MAVRKKPRKNYRKGAKNRRSLTVPGRLLLAFKLSAGITMVAAMTVFFILVYDLVTQSDYFRIRKLTVAGTHRLTAEQVVRQAGIAKKANILAVNISLARKRLLAHPWIATAEISRQIPDGLSIRIQEQQPLAIVDVGRRFLINQRGEIFKAWETSDPQNLPVISGLKLSDLKVDQRPEARSAVPYTPAFHAVMQVLQLGQQRTSILPNQLIRRIQVDRQIGLTVYAFDRLKAISLGYNDYPGKYSMLAKLMAYLKGQRHILDFDRIDLNNPQRVVVNPVKFESRATGS
jgi:cell division protein FtsQ